LNIQREVMMPHEERREALRKRLTPEMKAAIGAAVDGGRLPRSLLADLPRPSLEALGAVDRLESVLAVDALEAIVVFVGRPPLLVRNDKVVLEPMPELPADTPAKIRGVEKWVPSVGRIEFRNHSMAWGGTGWVVERSAKGAKVVTNRHVAQLIVRRKADGTAVFLRGPSGARYGAAIDFREEAATAAGDNSRTAELTRIEYLADDASADVALLLIEAADFELPSPFDLVNKQVEQDELVALIGYPAYDPRNEADAQARYFRDLYEVKRFAPGKVLQPPENGLLTYDCTSLGGNSGSPLIRLEDGKVAGLHFSGVYGKYNSAVSAKTLESLLRGERPVAVRLSQAPTEAKDGVHPETHFAGRKGFETRFLRGDDEEDPVETPWPRLPDDLSGVLAEPSDNPSETHELRYTHFGVKYSARHKLPLITAVNIDGGSSVRIKRGADQWFADGRIPQGLQLGADNFKDAEIDRGHMVRREDPNWGDQATAKLADEDTFHYVNAAAQHSQMNQGKALWQGLENYILDSARTHGLKACVFTGPILRGKEDVEDEIVIDGAIAPLEFWKLVATLDVDDKALHATAYVLSQGQLIQKLLDRRSRKEGLEGVVLGAYRTFQVAIADLADATGYDFGAYIQADPLARKEAGREALETGEPLFVPLEEAADMIL
jgi:endonuclease G, mitochondrial